MSTLRYEEVVHALRKEIPEFAPAIEEHISDNFGEALPHPLLGDLTRFIEKAWAEGNGELVARCLSWLERALLAGDEQTRNLVAVSFVENVGPWGSEKAHFINQWPPALRAEAERQKNWKPTVTTRRGWKQLAALLGTAWILVLGVLILRSTSIHIVWRLTLAAWGGIGLLHMTALFLNRDEAWDRWLRWVYGLGAVGLILVWVILLVREFAS